MDPFPITPKRTRPRRARRTTRSRRRSNHRARRTGRLLIGLSVANFLFLLFMWALEALVAERHGVTALLTYLPQMPFALPGIILLLAAAWKREVRAAAWTLAALSIAAFGLMDLRIGWPPPEPPAHGTPIVRVLSWNIHMGTAGLDRVAEDIRGADADVVCLQEAVRPHGRFSEAEVRAMLPGYSVWRTGDVLVGSRLPVQHTVVRRFPSPDLWRTAQQVDVVVGGRSVHILNVHYLTDTGTSWRGRRSRWDMERWRHSADLRREQTRDLLGWVNSLSGPVIVTGDFNTPPRGLVYRSLTDGMQSAFARAGRGFGFTWSTSLPVLRIDHIFVRGARPLHCRVLPARASDHKPLLAEIALRP